jgi:ATP-dependent DNA ligase
MEARSVEEIPAGNGWQYEPKWDGFRCIAFRDGRKIYLQSKAGQPLARYFPELRLHPAASRVQKLAKAHPAMFIIFDLLGQDRQSYLKRSLQERRAMLEEFARENFKTKSALRLSPATTNPATAKKWFAKVGGNLDGVIAKELNASYASGERTAAIKVKQIRSADWVVGGFRYASGARVLGSLLLGLYGEDGLLHHVGFTSSFKTNDRRVLAKKFEGLKKTPGFTGHAPGGASRWSTDRSGEWEPVDPKVVVEVAYDHFTGRFRHGTRILRWRPDKTPRQCTMEQVEHRDGKSLALL